MEKIGTVAVVPVNVCIKVSLYAQCTYKALLLVCKFQKGHVMSHRRI